MARKRVVRSAGVKAKVALAALSGESPAKVAGRFGVHPAQVATWKKRLVDGADELFADGRRRTQTDVSEQELFEQIGRLQMELAWLKKKVAQVE